MMTELLNIDPKKQILGHAFHPKHVRNMFSTGNFLDNMKLANTTPVFKKKDHLKRTIDL